MACDIPHRIIITGSMSNIYCTHGLWVEIGTRFAIISNCVSNIHRTKRVCNIFGTYTCFSYHISPHIQSRTRSLPIPEAYTDPSLREVHHVVTLVAPTHIVEGLDLFGGEDPIIKFEVGDGTVEIVGSSPRMRTECNPRICRQIEC